MASDVTQERQQAHELVDMLPVEKLGVVRGLLEALIHDDDDEELTDEDRQSVAASREYFRQGGKGIPFEQVVADLGFTMDQIRGNKSD